MPRIARAYPPSHAADSVRFAALDPISSRLTG